MFTSPGCGTRRHFTCNGLARVIDSEAIAQVIETRRLACAESVRVRAEQKSYWQSLGRDWSTVA